MTAAASGHFTLHVRLTKACNADCSYCSSYQHGAKGFMGVAAFCQAIDYLAEHVFASAAGRNRGSDTLSIQYVGGEVLTIPSAALKQCVLYARDRLSQVFGTVVDGVQSNLIGSAKRLSVLRGLFGSRVGTSVDHFTTQRTLGGSANRYRTFALASTERLERSGMVVPGIFVVNPESMQYAAREMDLAAADGRQLTLRAVFQGGKSIDLPDVSDLGRLYAALFEQWVMKMPIRVEPFHQLLGRRLTTRAGLSLSAGMESCPFQRNCADVSLDLEPDGSLYVCLDMADSGQYPLGNALRGEVDREALAQLKQRQWHLDQQCAVCPYQSECQGGCMSEAIAHTGSILGRTALCEVWMALFLHMDQAIDHFGLAAVRDWHAGLAA